MANQITIIGLGQIGTSIGLALANHPELVRVGHDKEFGMGRKAEKMGALDKVSNNLFNAVEKADLIVLALPVDQVKETLELIAKDLKPGTVVMDTAPIKAAVADWIQQVLPADRFYVGLTPVINPLYLMEPGRGIDAARADLFQKGLVAIVTPSHISSQAIQLATDFTSLLGAEHMFADVTEIDGLMAATHLLPQIISTALLNMTVDQAGWKEARKVAGRAFARVTDPTTSSDDPAALAYAAVYNSENVGRVLDTLIYTLQEIRAEVADRDSKALEERFTRARDGRLNWLGERSSANWAARELDPSSNVPSSTEWLGRLVGVRPKKKK